MERPAWPYCYGALWPRLLARFFSAFWARGAACRPPFYARAQNAKELRFVLVASFLRCSGCPCPGRAAPGTCAGFARTPAQYEVYHRSAFVLARLVGAFSPDPFPVSPVPAGDGERRVACGCPLRRGRGLPVCGCLLPARRKTGRAGSGRVVARRSSPVLLFWGRGNFLLDIRKYVRYYVGGWPAPAALTSCHTHGAAAAARKRRCVISPGTGSRYPHNVLFRSPGRAYPALPQAPGSAATRRFQIKSASQSCRPRGAFFMPERNKTYVILLRSRTQGTPATVCRYSNSLSITPPHTRFPGYPCPKPT